MTRDNIPAELLSDIKNYLDITWDDEAEDKRISGLTALGAAYLDDKMGDPADYTRDGQPRALLMEYVRYARDKALDVFEANYQALILAAQNGRAVTRYEQQLDSAGKTR